MELNTREIEFRGRDTDGKWYYGNLIKSHPIKDYKGYNWEYGIHAPSIFDNTAHLNWNLDVQYVRTETIGQYTGLRDKNGNKIYEGDILRYCDDTLLVVEFMHGMFGYKHLDYSIGLGANTNFHFWKYDKDDEFEIVGNIYDNPELIKEQDGNTKENTAAGL